MIAMLASPPHPPPPPVLPPPSPSPNPQITVLYANLLAQKIAPLFVPMGHEAFPRLLASHKVQDRLALQRARSHYQLSPVLRCLADLEGNPQVRPFLDVLRHQGVKYRVLPRRRVTTILREQPRYTPRLKPKFKLWFRRSDGRNRSRQQNLSQVLGSCEGCSLSPILVPWARSRILHGVREGLLPGGRATIQPRRRVRGHRSTEFLWHGLGHRPGRPSLLSAQECRGDRIRFFLQARSRIVIVLLLGLGRHFMLRRPPVELVAQRGPSRPLDIGKQMPMPAVAHIENPGILLTCATSHRTHPKMEHSVFVFA